MDETTSAVNAANEAQVSEGGLQCAKQVIDQGAGVTRQLECTRNSILLAAAVRQPTYDQLDEFVAASEALAKVAAKIVKYVEG